MLSLFPLPVEQGQLNLPYGTVLRISDSGKGEILEASSELWSRTGDLG